MKAIFARILPVIAGTACVVAEFATSEDAGKLALQKFCEKYAISPVRVHGRHCRALG